MSERLVVHGGVVLTGPLWVPTRSDLLLEDGALLEVGPPGVFDHVDAARHEATARLILPGFVNAHTHSHTVIARGAARYWTLEASLLNGGWMAAERRHELAELGTVLMAAESVASGATAVFDLVARAPEPDLDSLIATVTGHERVGVRAVVAPMVSDRALHPALGLDTCCAVPRGAEASDPALTDRVVAATRSFAEFAAGRAGIAAAVAPTIAAHCTAELFAGLDEVSRDHGLRVHTHLAESKPQALTGAERFGSITSELARRGVLDERLTAAHAIWLDAGDAAALAEAGCVAVMVPGSNLRLGSGVADARGLLEAGVRLAVGTDGANSADAFDVVDALRLTSLVSRIDERSSDRWLTVEETLDAATVGGAAALGLADTGRIAGGQAADLTFLDLRASAFRPALDLANQVVTAGRAADVTDVMVAGRFVYRDRVVTGVDLDAVVDRFDELAEEFLAHTATARREAAAHVDRCAPTLAARRRARWESARLLNGDLT